MTKTEKVLNHLKRYKYIDHAYALTVFQVKNLPAYILTLRKRGLNILTEDNKGRTRYKLLE